jgi:hypothetical protein
MHNKPTEDTTPLSSASPNVNNASSPTISNAGKVSLVYGAMAARTTYRTGVSIIRNRGNEQLANNLNNIANGATRLGLIIGTKGLALIPMGIEAIAETVAREDEISMENKRIDIENNLRGRRNRMVGGLGG